MATTSKLVVEIEAKAQQFNSALKGVSNRTDKLVAGIKKAQLAIVAFAAASVIGFKKVLNSINDVSNSIDGVAKLARSLDVPIRQLQALQFAANLAGVSSDEFNNSFNRLIKNVGDARTGLQTSVRYFEDIGINISELEGMKPTEIFLRVADAINKISDSTKAGFAALNLFGRSGFKYMNLLRSDIQGAVKEFDELGGGISDAQGQMAEAFNDAKTRFGVLTTAMKQNAVAVIAPAFQSLVDITRAWIQEQGGVKKVATEVAMVVLSSVKAILGAIQLITESIEKLRVGISSVGFYFNKISENLNRGILKASAALGITKQQQIAGRLQLSREREAAVSQQHFKTIDNFNNQGASTINSLMRALKASIDQNTQVLETTNKTAGKPAASAVPQSIGTIVDAATGRGLSFNPVTGKSEPAKIDVNITVDKDGLLKAVANNPDMKQVVVDIQNQNTEDAARAVRR